MPLVKLRIFDLFLVGICCWEFFKGDMISLCLSAEQFTGSPISIANSVNDVYAQCNTDPLKRHFRRFIVACVFLLICEILKSCNNTLTS